MDSIESLMNYSKKLITGIDFQLIVIAWLGIGNVRGILSKIHLKLE